MKPTLSILATVVALSAAVPAQAVDLGEASNRQLLAEVSRRLNESGNNNTAEAFITGVCGSGYVTFNLENSESGQTYAYNTYLGSECAAQLSKLRAKMGSFSGTRRLYLCSSAYLESVTARPASGFAKTSSYVGSDCQTQADDLNGLE
jgi:hypothetical protein